VDTANVAPVAPAGTVTLAGTEATDTLSLDNDTAAPPAGAGPLNVTVPWEELPPVTLDGFNDNEDTVGDATVTVRTAVLLLPP
jgi:hypothetical protein